MAIRVQDSSMEHRGVRYEVRIGIAPGQWCIAIYSRSGVLQKERTVIGTREEAAKTARSMINALLKKARLAEHASGYLGWMNGDVAAKSMRPA